MNMNDPEIKVKSVIICIYEKYQISLQISIVFLLY